MSEVNKIITITRDQVCNREVCPSCNSIDIDFIDCGCMCRIASLSCWSYPKCESCGYTAGGDAGNSDGGIWIAFSKLNSNDSYEITTK